jgi:hypothetical protein
LLLLLLLLLLLIIIIICLPKATTQGGLLYVCLLREGSPPDPCEECNNNNNNIHPPSLPAHSDSSPPSLIDLPGEREGGGSRWFSPQAQHITVGTAEVPSTPDVHRPNFKRGKGIFLKLIVVSVFTSKQSLPMLGHWNVARTVLVKLSSSWKN